MDSEDCLRSIGEREFHNLGIQLKKECLTELLKEWLWDIFIVAVDLVPHLLKCMNSEMLKFLVGDFKLLTQNMISLMYIKGRRPKDISLDL